MTSIQVRVGGDEKGKGGKRIERGRNGERVYTQLHKFWALFSCSLALPGLEFLALI